VIAWGLEYKTFLEYAAILGAVRLLGEMGLANMIEGSVTEISKSGDLVTDITSGQLKDVPRDQSVTVSFGPHETVGIHTKDHGEPDSTLIAVVGDSERLEVGIVGISIHEMLGVQIGEKVVVKW